MVTVEPEIREALQALAAAEGLLDPRWIVDLDDLDEPPLFTRARQVEFLRRLSMPERGTAVLELGTRLVLELEDLLAKLGTGPGQTYFIALTVADWELVARGEQSVPTVSIQVNPHEERLSTPIGFYSAGGQHAQEVRDWLARVEHGAGRFCVAQSEVRDDASQRIYVGLASPRTPALVSVGNYLRSRADPDPSSQAVKPSRRGGTR